MRTILIAAGLLLYLVLPSCAQEDSAGVEAVIEAYDAGAEPENPHTLLSPNELKTSEKYQSQELNLQRFDEAKWKAIVKDVDYTAQEEDEKRTVSAPWNGIVLKIISFVVIAALLIALIYYVTRHISLDVKIERTAIETEDAAAPVEDIAQLDIEQLLEQAKRESNYKLAVRLYYLGLLKRLNEKGAIVWKKDKTNREYLNELFAANLLFDEVRRLTLSYEAVWYGDHDLRPETFQFLTTQFENAYSSINSEKA